MTNEMTATGLENLKKQLDETRIQLRDVAFRIKEARDLGDLSENAEYLGAKEEQAFLMGRAAELEQKVRSAKVIQKKGTVSAITVGCRVVVQNDKNKTMNFEIVGSSEADPMQGRISPDSPIGAALYGHKKGEKIAVATPAGKTEYTILDIG